MAGKIMAAPVGSRTNALFVGIRNFPTEKVVLISRKEDKKQAEKIRKDLDRFKIPAAVQEMNGNLWEEMFRIVGEISKSGNEDILVNVSTGSEMLNCAALSAAYVNGIKAIGVNGSEVMVLPVLKFSYYKMLTDRKMEILKKIYEDSECCSSLEELSKITGMSLPLVSYHVNGNLKSDGLKDLGLVETTEKKGKTSITTTTLGRLLIKGYL